MVTAPLWFRSGLSGMDRNRYKKEPEQVLISSHPEEIYEILKGQKTLPGVVECPVVVYAKQIELILLLAGKTFDYYQNI